MTSNHLSSYKTIILKLSYTAYLSDSTVVVVFFPFSFSKNDSAGRNILEDQTVIRIQAVLKIKVQSLNFVKSL